MRVGIFTNNYLPTLGGVPHSIETLRIGLERSGHRAYVFAPSVPGFSDPSPHVFRIPSFSAPTYPNFFVPLPFIYSRLRPVVRELDLDIFHAHHPFLLGQAARRLAITFRRPLVFTYHTRYESYAHYIPFILQAMVRRKAIQWSTRFSNRSDLTIAPSHGTSTALRQQGVTGPIEVVPTGVDLARFAPGNKRLARSALGLPSDAAILLYVGRLDKEKSVGFLLQVFQRVGAKMPSAYLVLIGQGKEGQRLRSVASMLSSGSRIIFAGPAQPETVARYYCAAEIFVFASQTETQGLSVAEAHAAGLPVVAIRAGGVEEVVRDGETGLLVSPDVNQFASTLRELLLDQSRRLQMGVRAREVAVNEFSADRSVARHVELYSELVGSRR